MNLLQLIQEFCKRRTLPVPASAISNPDPGVMQLVGMMNEFVEDLQTRKVWQRNTFETTFVSTAAEDQGDITTLCPYGYEEILWETFFDRTQRLPVRGGLSPAEWQARKAFNVTGPWYQFRLRQNRLLFTPALPVNHTIAFEYNSSYFIKDATILPPLAGAYKQYWANDLDTCTLGDSIPLTWLMYKWAERKGFDYAEAFNSYERLIAVKSARDAVPMKVNISDTFCELRPGVIVPSGNWLVP
jgi:hypothetical protein